MNEGSILDLVGKKSRASMSTSARSVEHFGVLLFDLSACSSTKASEVLQGRPPTAENLA